jgi:hypothetical protein
MDINNFEIILLSNDELPSKFILKANYSHYNFKLRFQKIEGLLNNPAQNKDVFIKNQNGYERSATAKLVFFFLLLFVTK